MEIHEQVLLSELTTFKIGGPAAFYAYATSEADVAYAVSYAQEHHVPFMVLGQGSNLLASDAGFPGLVIHMAIDGIDMRKEEGHVLLTAGAGVSWDAFVREAAARGLWGIENLAGIPGTVGAAPVQNIGAYGAEVRQTFASARVLDASTGEIHIMDAAACAFGYRESRFKHERNLIILSVTFRLTRFGTPQIGYADLVKAQEAGSDLSTPAAIGESVRSIRAKKFPDLTVYGTAGSFWKNPVLSAAHYEELTKRLGDVPTYPAADGIKIPLAFILDKVLGLRGYTRGPVGLFNAQALVVVAEPGATAADVDALVEEVGKRVFEVSGIIIEREVRSL